ncbi:MAG: AAA family ATPase, partial [Candidatus Limnocylindrales bacterium]
MDEEIVGRSAELEVIERFAARLSGGPHGLAIQGEAGIGKTTLWLRAVAAADAAGAQVLQARPASPEVRVSFSALVDLFERVPDALFAELPPPQRTALEVALYRVHASGDPESSIVGVAVLHAIRLLAADRPVVIAVDEAQWLDRPSRTALEYAVRRLRDERVGVLVAERVSADTPADSPADGPMGDDLPSFLDGGGVDRLVLGPIPVGALHHLVRTRLGISLPRPTLLWVHDQAAGNPFYALELARAWGSSVVPGERQVRGGALPTVPPSLHDLLRRRIDVLPERTRELLLIAALSTHPTLDVVAGAADETAESVAELLEPARAAGVIEVAEGGALRIAHPLLAATIRAAASSVRRRAGHRRLAELAADPEEHARHLAAGADAPDLAIAQDLATAADLAATRGAIAAAVELLDEAERLWPITDRAGHQRLLLARAERIFLSGDTMRAHNELDGLLRVVEDPATRLEAEILLATVIVYDGDGRDACRLMEDALTRAADPATQARIHARLAWMYEHDLEAAARHSRLAVELIDPDADPGTYAFGLMNAAALELQLGRGADVAAIARGHELQERSGVWDFSTLPANWAKWMDDFDRSRDLNEGYLERSRQMGDESSVAHLLGYLVELECWTGHMDRATRLADEAVDAAEQTAQPSYLSAALARRALVRAYCGRLQDARSDASRALE